MSSLPHVATILQTLCTTEANAVARSSGFIQRQRQLSGASFLQALVFGFLANPRISLDQLAQAATAAGSPISAQGFDQRFTSHAARFLQTILATAVQHMVCATPAALPLLQRFAGVYVLDSTTIVLPDELRTLWQGCGGSTSRRTSAALKVQVLWNLSHGQLQHVELQPGRASDNRAMVQHVELPPGALRIADLGYFALDQIATMTKNGVDVLSRFSPQVAVYDHAQRRVDLLDLLERCATPTLDVAVTMGAEQRIPVRLLAVRVPQEVFDQRRRRLREAHRAKGKVPNARTLALLAWTIVVTSVPVERLSLPEALVLLRARWQIEVLFKVWKSQAAVDEWRSEQPWRILCEVYAKLLGMVVMHWVMLVSSWAYANRSLTKTAQTVQQHAYVLVCAVRESATRIVEALTAIQRSLSVGGRLNRRIVKPNTYQLLIEAPLLC